MCDMRAIEYSCPGSTTSSMRSMCVVSGVFRENDHDLKAVSSLGTIMMLVILLISKLKFHTYPLDREKN